MVTSDPKHDHKDEAASNVYKHEDEFSDRKWSGVEDVEQCTSNDKWHDEQCCLP